MCTHRFAHEHAQGADVHEKAIVDHARHHSINNFTSKWPPDDGTVRECVFCHSRARHEDGFADLVDFDNLDDHLGALHLPLHVLVQPVLDLSVCRAIEEGWMQRTFSDSVCNEEHFGGRGEGERNCNCDTRFWQSRGRGAQLVQRLHNQVLPHVVSSWLGRYGCIIGVGRMCWARVGGG